MKNKFLGLLVSMLLLAGCSAGISETDITEMTKYSMVQIYQGHTESTFEDKYGATFEESLQITQAGMEVEADFFSRYFELEELSQEHLDRIVAAYTELYKHAKYNVEDAVKAGEEFVIYVELSPILTIIELSDEIVGMILAEEVDVYDNPVYNELVVSKFEEAVASGVVNYGESVRVLASVTAVDNMYSITQDSIMEIDEFVISY